MVGGWQGSLHATGDEAKHIGSWPRASLPVAAMLALGVQPCREAIAVQTHREPAPHLVTRSGDAGHRRPNAVGKTILEIGDLWGHIDAAWVSVYNNDSNP